MSYHLTIKKDTIDDLMHYAFNSCKNKGKIIGSTRGKNNQIKEVIDAKLILSNPLSRLSISGNRSTPFSALGEFFWYLSGSDKLDFIKYYIPRYKKESEDGKVVIGAYGPRIMGQVAPFNQLENIISLLKKRESSKKAVIQVFDKNDLSDHINHEHNSVPCTLTLQFLVRDDKVNLIVNMRSNDIIYGLPHDLFAFTMIQEIVARELRKELGLYIHNVGSLHYYIEKENLIEQYMEEGYQSTVLGEMPKMPSNPMQNLSTLLDIEQRIRRGIDVDVGNFSLEDYWHDIVLLLNCFRYYKEKEQISFLEEKNKFKNNLFKNFTDKKTLSFN